MNDASGTERTAQLEKAVLQTLELLERGEIEAARDELLRVAPATPAEPEHAISDLELDAAFADASAEVDQMLDADGVAEAAIAATDSALHDERSVGLESDAGEEFTYAVDAGAEVPRVDEIGDRFATATMAKLLSEQGDESGASKIRANLVPEDEPAASGTEATPATRERVVRTLESWLDNLRGGART